MGRTANAIEWFLSSLKDGKTFIAPKVWSDLEPELRRVRYDENGQIDLLTCSPKLRSIARAAHLAQGVFEEQPTAPVADTSDDTGPVDLGGYNRRLFEHLEELFRAFTEQSSASFAADGDFGSAVRAMGAKLNRNPRAASVFAERVNSAFETLQRYYVNNTHGISLGIRSLGGSKLVLGGTQSFRQSALASVRSMLLYADTVLIPDPVFRWVEASKEASERESSWRLQMLEDLWWLLKLSPLTAANLATPAIVVFPSFEKTLEARDEYTQFGMQREFLELLQYFLGARFDEIVDLQHFVSQNNASFWKSIRANKLFVPLGGKPGGHLRVAIKRQRAELQKARSEAFAAQISRLSDEQIVIMTIAERMTPLFHLNENAQGLDASPLMSLPVHWHYAQLRSTALGATDGAVDANTALLLRAFEEGPKVWLGRVPIDQLVQLRRDGANHVFRARMASMMERVATTGRADLGRVTAELKHEFGLITQEHDAEARRIDERFRSSSGAIVATTLLTVAAAFSPWFPSFGAAGVLGAATAVLGETVKAMNDRRQLGKTLIGVLAAAARDPE